MALFDVDKYMENIHNVKKLKLESLKIQPTDIERLIGEVRTVTLKVYIEGVIDTSIDWNFEDVNVKPSDLANELSEKIHIEDSERKQQLLEQMTDIIKQEAIRIVEYHLGQQTISTRKKKVSASTIACPE